jgi:hypothetical protein
MSSEESKKPMSTAKVCHQEPARKMSKHEAAHRLAQIAEESMERKGLSEGKKNAKVQNFVGYVNAVNAAHATRAK